MSDNTNETAQHRGKKLPAAILIAAILTGCGQAEEPAADKLPSVTDYSAQASSVRMIETERWHWETEGSVSLSSDSETVSAGSAASRQTEAVTSHETEPSETEAPEEASSEPVSEAVTTEKEAIPSESEASETSPVSSEASEITGSSAAEAPETMELETECSVPAAPAPAPDASYDSDFFSSDLFIGDSISTGYSLYGFLSEKNVFAKVGLNPSTVLTKSVSTCYGDIGINEMLTYTMPRRVYIMLGSNGIQWLSVGNMLQSTNTLVTLIKDTCPECDVVIISVPPVTAAYDSTVEDVNVMAKINEYNSSLNAYCTANKMLFVDAASILKDETGYFNSTYAESDGMHFKSSAYKTLLSKIQSDVTEFEEANVTSETEAPAEETAAEASEEEISSETEKASETIPETFVTLPKQTEKTDE
ncbi:MAG: hypothetical protein MSJ26_06500 [Oscillospiraceae bacterium]|nr:hypothetical protein [Oscillospiraceae bacterium]